jgi:DNA-binding PadR family transcriptional regulator
VSTRLVILGLLRERPLYGYELKHIIEEHMGDWTKIAFGSIYFALGKLADEGFVVKIATEKEGKRPARSVYQITAEGRTEFLRLLREVWTEVERHYYAIDVGLSFASALPSAEVQGYLHRRVSQLEEMLRHLDEHQEETMQDKSVPRLAAVMFQHSRVHFQAELDWTRGLLQEFEVGLIA